ncbi:MAG: hypothetical protein PHF76_12545 [Bacteroidales bacterium]|nr:hypothetical protein [Acholeplasmataceae bacterium]MDD3915462.1 hypothetical protein [Bacteroidales bacterium]
MEVTSVLYKNTDQIDEDAYEKFILKTMKQLKRCWTSFYPGEELTEDELRKKAEDVCGMYEHQFRVLVRV